MLGSDCGCLEPGYATTSAAAPDRDKLNMVDRQLARLDKVTSLIGAGLLADASDFLDRDSLLTAEQKAQVRQKLQEAKSARLRRQEQLAQERAKSSKANVVHNAKYDVSAVKNLLTSLSSGDNLERYDLVLTSFSALESAEAGLILARFGIDGSDPKPYWQLADMTKLSVQRVRMIEARALQKIADRLSIQDPAQFVDDGISVFKPAIAPTPVTPEPVSNKFKPEAEVDPAEQASTRASRVSALSDSPAGDERPAPMDTLEAPENHRSTSPFSTEPVVDDSDDLDELLDLLRPISSRTQDASPSLSHSEDSVAIYSVYKGVKTKARLYPTVGAVEIVDGPLAGRDYATPSGAAKAVVAHYSPNVLNPLRNGWAFWLVYDGSGNQISVFRR
ncbi:hypothetical protein ACFULT_21165 [Rhodococcus sp. NPDC057297]|uniref:hypothetical protein n=1 Tax=Rhodococcus sp. NPDC057297 TaxID=3346090 RepID=UPI00363B889F